MNITDNDFDLAIALSFSEVDSPPRPEPRNATEEAVIAVAQVEFSQNENTPTQATANAKANLYQYKPLYVSLPACESEQIPTTSQEPPPSYDANPPIESMRHIHCVYQTLLSTLESLPSIPTINTDLISSAFKKENPWLLVKI